MNTAQWTHDHPHAADVREDPKLVQFPLVNWRTVLAGLLVSLLTYGILISLGIAVGGLSLKGIIESGDGAGGLATGAGIWLVVSSLLSLLAGSYFGSRVSNFHTRRIGAAQGLVIAGSFFALMTFQAGAMLGTAGRAIGSLASGVGSGAVTAMQSPDVQETLQRGFGDKIKGDPKVVAQGLATRLLRGDEDGARRFLARQTNLPTAEFDARFATVRADLVDTAQRVGQDAAKAVSAAGWTLFGLMLLGTGAALFGGALGAQANLRKPLTTGQDPHQVSIVRAGL